MRSFTPWRRNQGTVLEIVLLTAMVVFILAASMIDIGAARFRGASTRYRQTQAFYYAEAGIARAAAALSRGAELDWVSEEQAFGDGFYRIDLLRGAADDTVTVISTGEFRRPNGERIAVGLQATLKPSTADGGYELVSWRYVNP